MKMSIINCLYCGKYSTEYIATHITCVKWKTSLLSKAEASYDTV